MRSLCLLILLLSTLLHARSLPIQKPMRDTGEQNVTGWVMSEKLDGVRGYWDGKRLLTKNGHLLHPPEWFTQNLPPFPLDGELWSKRGDFENIQSIVLDTRPSEAWHMIGYHIFEVPHAEGDFFARLQKARDWFAAHPAAHVHIIPQIGLKNRDALQKFLGEVVKKGGEGVIVKDPSLPYFSGRSGHILKVKPAPDMEGEVIAINPGKGRLKGLMGSLTLRLKEGTTFRLGSGFSDYLRRHPPAIGSTVTFRYHGFTKNRIPKFASFMRVRKSE